MSAREELYAYTTVAFEDGVPPMVHDHLTRMLDAYRAEVLRETAEAANPARPEVSFFGVYGPQVADWLRRIASSSPSPAAGDKQPETELRDRIRRALAEADGFEFSCLEPHDYQRHVNAMLAIFHAPASKGGA